MPLNCPLHIDGSCEGCRLNYENECCWFFPARPLYELLTIEERVEALEHKAPDPETGFIFYSKEWDVLNQVKSEMINIRKSIYGLSARLDEITEKKPKQPKGIEV